VGGAGGGTRVGVTGGTVLVAGTAVGDAGANVAGVGGTGLAVTARAAVGAGVGEDAGVGVVSHPDVLSRTKNSPAMAARPRISIKESS
jgi:hypothetical protein